MENSITFFVNGIYQTLHYHLDLTSALSKDNIEQFTRQKTVVIGRDNSFGSLILPECYDHDRATDDYSLKLIKPISKWMYEPDVTDIEACYYDDLGLTDTMRNFYSQFILIDYNDDPIQSFSDALVQSYPEILSFRSKTDFSLI